MLLLSDLFDASVIFQTFTYLHMRGKPIKMLYKHTPAQFQDNVFVRIKTF